MNTKKIMIAWPTAKCTSGSNNAAANLNSGEWLSRKESLFSSSSMTSLTACGTTRSLTRSRNFSDTASLSSFYLHQPVKHEHDNRGMQTTMYTHKLMSVIVGLFFLPWRHTFESHLDLKFFHVRIWWHFLSQQIAVESAQSSLSYTK